MNIAIIAQDTKKELMVHSASLIAESSESTNSVPLPEPENLFLMQPALKFPVSSAEAMAAVNR